MGGFLTKEQVTVLRQAHKTLRDKRLADRIKAIISLNAGHHYQQVASILLLDEITLRRYVKSFKDKGLDGLLEFHYTGGQTKLTQAQELELKTHLAEGSHIYLTAKEVAVLQKHQLGRIYLIWDNARYYYCKDVQTYLKHHPRLIPTFLPSYSPNLKLN